MLSAESRSSRSLSRAESDSIAAGLPGNKPLQLKHLGWPRCRVEDGVPDELEIWLQANGGRELEGVHGFEDVLVAVVNGLLGRRGLAPDEADAEDVVGQTRHDAYVSERRLEDEARAHLRGRSG